MVRDVLLEMTDESMCMNARSQPRKIQVRGLPGKGTRSLNSLRMKSFRMFAKQKAKGKYDPNFGKQRTELSAGTPWVYSL